MSILDRALRLGEATPVQAVREARRPDQRLGARARAARRRRAARERRRAARARAQAARRSRTCCPRPSRSCARSAAARMSMRHFDVQMIGGMVLHDGSIAEMKTGEGKTLTATTAVVLNALAGEGVHVVTVNDYLARRDADWMRPIYEALGLTVGVLQNMQPYEEKRAGLRVGHHVRHELRVRVRLPARQHGHDAGREGPARRPLRRGRQAAHLPPLRDRRRGRQHPHRRGPHAADHLRRPRAGRRLLRAVRQARPADGAGQEARGDGPEVQEGLHGRLRLRVRREAQERLDHRARRRQGREVPRHRPPLQGRERPAGQPPAPVAEGRVAVQARRRLRGGRRRGQDHRRVHRPHPRRPPLVGGPAPGGRGQGGRARPRGEPDARDDHAPELLPHVRQARRHDGHGAHRGQRVHEDLQAAGGRDPDQPADGPRGPATTRSSRPWTASGRPSCARSPSATRRASRCSSARSRSRSPSCWRASCASAASRTRCSTPSPSTPSARARRSPRPAARRGHDRHQHGRPRRRHQARRQRRAPHAARAGQARPAARRPRLRRALQATSCRAIEAQGRGRTASRCSRPAGCYICRHRAPRVAPDRQPAARPLRPPGRPRRVALLPLRRGRPRAPVRGRPHLPHPRPPRPRPARRARRSRSRPRCSRSRSRAPSARSRSRTSSSASASSSTTTS